MSGTCSGMVKRASRKSGPPRSTTALQDHDERGPREGLPKRSQTALFCSPNGRKRRHQRECRGRQPAARNEGRENLSDQIDGTLLYRATDATKCARGIAGTIVTLRPSEQSEIRQKSLLDLVTRAYNQSGLSDRTGVQLRAACRSANLDPVALLGR